MIIKNYEEIIDKSLKKDSLDILIAGVKEVLPTNILQNKIKFNKENNSLKINDITYDIRGDIYIIGFGKASALMAQCMEKQIGIENIKAGIVIDKTDNTVTQKIKVYKGSHPIPDEKNVKISKEIIKLAKNLNKQDLVICLISGGGSALFTIPVNGINISDVQKLTEKMIKCGAEVFEINILRKHLSKVKGGKLTKYLQPATITSIIFSDTIDDTFDSTSSGPTTPDKSTFVDAYRILKKYNLLNLAHLSIVEYIKSNVDKIKNETIKSDDNVFNNLHNFIVADNTFALQAMKKKALSLGYKKVCILTNKLNGESKEVAKKMGEYFRNISEKEICVLYAGETTVTVSGDGKGGRLQEYVAALIPEISDLENCVCASLGSDGVDFIDGIGGAIADNNTLEKCKENNIDINNMLSRNNSYELHKKLGTLLKSNPTNTNVADLHVFIKG